MSHSTTTTPPATAREATAAALEQAGWPEVAADVRACLGREQILQRLRSIHEGESEAATIVAQMVEVTHPGGGQELRLLRVFIDECPDTAPDRRVRAGVLQGDELADALGRDPDELDALLYGLVKGTPHSESLGDHEQVLLIPLEAIDGLAAVDRDASTPGRAIGDLKVRFSAVSEFTAELLADRDQVLHAIVRATKQRRPACGGAYSHLSVVAGYLMGSREGTLLVELEHYCGELWSMERDRDALSHAEEAIEAIEQAASEAGLRCRAGRLVRTSER